MLVHADPATQVSVERSFSLLKMVLTDICYNLSAEVLKQNLCIKQNTEIKQYICKWKGDEEQSEIEWYY